MKSISKVLIGLGFLISLISIFLNTVVISAFSEKIKAVDIEANSLSKSITEQYNKDVYTIIYETSYVTLKNLALGMPAEYKEIVNTDAKNAMGNYLLSAHIAAKDISTLDVMKAQTEVATAESELIEQAIKTLELMKSASSLAEAEQRRAEALVLLDKEAEPKSEYAKKRREFKTFAKKWNEEDLSSLLELNNIQKSLLQQETEVLHKKEQRLRELADLKLYWDMLSRYSTFFAVSLQVLGLMFIFLNDLTKSASPSNPG